MRAAQVVFVAQNPNARYRHEKPDVKNLLEKKDETYVDVASAAWTFTFPTILPSIRKVIGCSDRQ